jgi:hypothetical protein
MLDERWSDGQGQERAPAGGDEIGPHGGGNVGHGQRRLPQHGDRYVAHGTPNGGDRGGSGEGRQGKMRGEEPGQRQKAGAGPVDDLARHHEVAWILGDVTAADHQGRQQIRASIG